METVGINIAVVVLTLLLREGVPGLVTYVRARSEAGRTSAEDRRLDSAEERKARSEDADRQERADNLTIKELRELLDFRTKELEAERAEHRRERHECVDKLNTLTTQLLQVREVCARLEAYVESYSDALTNAKIPHRRYVPPAPPGSGPHISLSPDAGGAK